MLVCFINGYSTTGDPILSSGWELLDSEVVSVFRSAVAWKVATSTSDTLSVTPNAVYAQAVCVTMTGNADTAPISSGEWAVATSSAAGDVMTHPTVTAAKDGSALLLFRTVGGTSAVTFTSSVTSASSPAGVEVYDGPGSGSVDMAIYARDGGFTGAQSFTTTSSSPLANHQMWSILVHPTLNTPVDLGTGTCTSVSGGSSSLDVEKHYILTGTSSSDSAASAALDIEQHFVLSGDSASSSEVSATGRLFRNRKVSGAATSVSEAGDAPLKLGYTLFGDLTSVSGSSAVLKRMLGLSCEIISAASDSTARLTRQKRLTGSLDSASSVASPTLSVNAVLLSTVTSITEVADAQILRDRGLVASSDSSSSLTSQVALSLDLDGSSVSVSAVSAALLVDTPVSVAGSSSSVSSGSGQLTRHRHIHGAIPSISSASGLLRATYNLYSSVAAVSSGHGYLLRERPAPYAFYEFFIDWDRDNGLRVSDFETDFDGWGPTDLLELSTDQSYSGDSCLKAAWQNQTPSSNPTNTFKFGDGTKGFDTGVFGYTSAIPADDEVLSITYDFSGLTPGDHYFFSVWVYVPSVGGQHVTVGVEGLATSAPTSVTNQWVNVRQEFVPTASEHTLVIKASGTVTNGNVTYIDYAFVEGEFENVTEQTRIDDVSWSFGRDQSRALSPISPAETEIVLDNQDGRYAANNTGSPIADYLLPNRELLIRATYNGKVYDLLRAYLDDITEDPYVTEQEVKFSAIDPLASVSGTLLSTQVWQGLRTGDAINKVLDEVGWPAERRDIDPGATVLAHFWVEGQDASDAITDLVASEGPPAYATVSNAGYFIFRDRHHRIVNPRSSTVQATFNASGTEPCFSPPAEINVGWKDIINSVTLAVVTRTPQIGQRENNGTDEENPSNPRVPINPPVVWSTDTVVSVPAGQSVTLKVTVDNPVLYFTLPDIAHDDVIVAGGDVQMSLSRTSGQSCELTVMAPSTDIAITGLKVRGYPLEDQDGVTVTVVDDGSVTMVGEKSDSNNVEAPWANANDAQAIGDIITRMRGRRLPTMSITVNNGTFQRLKEILTRRLSDLIHIVEPRSYTDHDFYIESIEHSIEQGGKLHTVKFGCEAVPTVVDPSDEIVNPFTFGDPYSGFDSGVFAYDTIQSNPDDVFILDVSKLDEDGLGF